MQDQDNASDTLNTTPVNLLPFPAPAEVIGPQGEEGPVGDPVEVPTESAIIIPETPQDPKDHLLDWAESILCSSLPMSHCSQEDWDSTITAWRDEKHEVKPDGDQGVLPLAEFGPNAKPLFHLPDRYKSALMGHTVSGVSRPRFIYSLTKLVKAVMADEECREEQAQDRVFAMIIKAEAQHKLNAPAFVDDLVAEQIAAEIAATPKSLIYTGQ